MKKTIRNLLAMALAAQMTVSLAACGSKKKDNSAGSASSGAGSAASESGDTKGASKAAASGAGRIVKESDPYFTVNASKLQAKTNKDKEIQYSDQNQHFIAGDLIVSNVVVTYKMPKDVEKQLDSLNLYDDKQMEQYEKIANEYHENTLQIFNLNGECLSTIPMEDTIEFVGAFPGAKDEILIVCSKLNMKDCSSKPVLFVISKTGEKLRDINVKIDGDLHDMRVYALENGNYLMASVGCLYLLDAEGNQISKQENPNLCGTLLYSGGKWYAAVPQMTADGQQPFIQEIDTAQGKLVGKPIQSSYDIFYINQGTKDCFVMDSNGIDKFDPVTSEKTRIMAWKDTDINFMTLDITGAQILSENEMMFFQREYVEDNGRDSMDRKASGASEVSVVNLTKADKNPHAGKTVLKLGMNGEITSDFVEKVLRYNQDESRAARIEIFDYDTDQEDYKFDWSGNLIVDSKTANQLQLDMLSGDSPDIIVGFSGASQFNDPSMLLDLNTYLDSDSSINRENYFDNIFRAFETDGKLYTIPLTYNIEGLAVNSKYSGAKENWTYADFDQMASSLPDDVMPIASDSYDRLLQAWMMHNSSLFIDYTNKKVDFESDEFKHLLETVKKYGQISEQISTKTDNPFMSEGAMFRNDMVAASSASLYDLQTYCRLFRKQSDNIILTGIPSSSEIGMTVRGHLTMSITAHSENPDAAWDFISSFLSEDVQQQLSFNRTLFPVNRNAFKTNCSTELEINHAEIKSLREEASGLPPEKVGNLDDYILELTQEKADSLEVLIGTVKHAQATDTDVMDIILEEAAGYFAGQRSIDDVCKNIQNRASLVVQER